MIGQQRAAGSMLQDRGSPVTFEPASAENGYLYDPTTCMLFTPPTLFFLGIAPTHDGNAIETAKT